MCMCMFIESTQFLHNAVHQLPNLHCLVVLYCLKLVLAYGQRCLSALYKTYFEAKVRSSVFRSFFFSNYIYLTLMNAWESMGKPCSCTQFIKCCILYYKSCKNPYQYYKSHKNSYQVLQVTCVCLNVQ